MLSLILFDPVAKTLGLLIIQLDKLVQMLLSDRSKVAQSADGAGQISI